MTKNCKLARRIVDASWPTFADFCQYKTDRTVGVEPTHSSAGCSCCSHPASKSLAVRAYVCPMCWTVLDGDYHSALNHLQNGTTLLQLPVERREVTPVEPPVRPVKQEEEVTGLVL